MRWKAFTLLYDKFIQDNIYQILSELAIQDIIKKHFGVFFSFHSVVGSDVKKTISLKTKTKATESKTKTKTKVGKTNTKSPRPM